MKKIFFSLSLALICHVAIGQKNLEDLGNIPIKKYFKDTFLYSTINKDLIKLLNKGRIGIEELPKLEKIGLLSIYIKDEAFRKGRRGGATYRHAENENQLTAGILKAALPSIKKGMKEMGIKLLTPDLYLDDEDKKFLYRNFSINYSGMPEAKRFGEYFDRNTDSFASPSNYKTLYTTYSGENSDEIVHQMGVLSKELGLDAVMVIEVTTQTTGKTFIFESVTGMLFAPDPSDDNYGLLLGSCKYAPSRLLAFASWENDQIDQSRYDGFDPIISRMTNHLTEVVLDEINSIE